METTAHAMHECAGSRVEELIQWRRDVIKRLRRMVAYVNAIGVDAHDLRVQIRGALTAMSRQCPHGEPYEELKRTIGGALPGWGGGDLEAHDKKHNATLESMIRDIYKAYL